MRILILFSYPFLSVDTNSQKLKVDQIFWLDVIKNGCGQSGFGTLELTCVENEQIKLTDFFQASRNSHKLKNGCGESGHKTLNLTVKNELMKQTDFLHVDIDSQKLKADQIFLEEHCQKWVWPVQSQDSKIDYISKRNSWNKLILCMLVQIRER